MSKDNKHIPLENCILNMNTCIVYLLISVLGLYLHLGFKNLERGDTDSFSFWAWDGKIDTAILSKTIYVNIFYSSGCLSI